jgi:hypothetical protein
MYSVVKRPLYVPPLTEVAVILQAALSKNFKNVSVSVVPCPDLTKTPFKCASSGLCGSTAIADVGGTQNMHYVANHNKYHFEIKELSKIMTGLPFFIGAAATKPALAFRKDNSELIPNMDIKSGKYLSKEAYVGTDGKGCLVDYPHAEFSCLGNFFVSEGKPGPVLKILASQRTGSLNVVTVMRQALAEHYGKENQVGLGGVLLINKGKIRSHIMPSYPPCDVAGGKIEWLTYYEVPAPLHCLSVLVSVDKHQDDLRVEHTHFFSLDEKHGGHYHYDTTPQEVEYEGYYNIATDLYRIGRAYPPKPTESKL